MTAERATIEHAASKLRGHLALLHDLRLSSRRGLTRRPRYYRPRDRPCHDAGAQAYSRTRFCSRNNYISNVSPTSWPLACFIHVTQAIRSSREKCLRSGDSFHSMMTYSSHSVSSETGAGNTRWAEVQASRRPSRALHYDATTPSRLSSAGLRYDDSCVRRR